jgi:hypothetical protein
VGGFCKNYKRYIFKQMVGIGLMSRFRCNLKLVGQIWKGFDMYGLILVY